MGLNGNSFNTSRVEIFEMFELESGSQWDHLEENRNCNACTSDFNPEAPPHVGCGCTFNYNGYAGAGTAACGCEPEPKCCPKKEFYDNGCPREFDPEVLIFGHKMGETYHKKVDIVLSSSHNCCDTIYENKLMGTHCHDQKTHHCPRTNGGCSTYETELVNKKPECCGWPEDDNCCCQVSHCKK